MDAPQSNSPDVTIQPRYKDFSAPVPDRVADLLARMNLEEKIGQMTQVEKNSIFPGDVARYFIGSILSGGGGYPPENTPIGWKKMTGDYQEKALHTRLSIPILYAVDAVHGHGNLYGAVLFPHNIGLGATRDPELVYRTGRATAEELAITGVHWNFFPTVAVPQDIRWGRTYESYSENTELVSALAVAYVKGLQGDGLDTSATVLATSKHFVGDGATTWGSSTTKFYFGGVWTGPGEPPTVEFKIDSGDVQVDETTLRAIHLVPYIATIAAGVQIVMASFSSLAGVKMHGNKYMLTDVLKGELGFQGFVVTDWGGIDWLSPDYYQAVVTGINAGIDMVMVPQDYLRFISTLREAVENGDISLERVNDAVRRILTVKFKHGLFEKPFADPALFSMVDFDEHRKLAREAVAKSLVLLKNEGQTLPLSKSLPLIFIAGEGADDVGLQCGGWTIEWQGGRGEITPGTTILEAVKATVSPGAMVEYDPEGTFDQLIDESGNPIIAEAGIVVVGETPYAEGFGDEADLSLSSADQALIERIRQRSKKLVVVMLSGRPMIVTDQLPLMDAFVAAWLPGTEGQGVADVLYGDVPFTGKLPYAWPRNMDQVPSSSASKDTDEANPLFPYGYGLP